MHHKPSRDQLRQLDQDCRKAATEACRLDAAGSYEEAMTMYAMAKCFLEDAIRFSEDYDRQRRYAEAAESYGARGHALEVLIRQQRHTAPSSSAAAAAPTEKQRPPTATSQGSAGADASPRRMPSTQPPPYSSPHAPNVSAPQHSPPKKPQQQQQQQHRPAPNGRPAVHAAGRAGSTQVSRPAQSRQLDPFFLSLPPAGTPTVRAVIHIDAGADQFDGEVNLPTAAFQRFLAKKAEMSQATPAQRDSAEADADPHTPTRGQRTASPDDRADPAAAARNPPGVGRTAQQDGSGTPADPRPAVEPAVDADGVIVGARTAFGQEAPRGQDSGVAYRDKNWNDLVRQSQNKVGPPQVALDEKVTLSEQSEQRQRQAQPSNARINAKTTDGRIYSIDGGLETQAFIDPNRTLNEVLSTNSEPKPAPPDLKSVVGSPDVLFETTAMGAKLRNQHRIGGERVKEMDHFVASVETPVVRITQKDVAPLVAEMEMRGAEPIMILSVSDTEHYAGEVGDVELKIQSRYRNADGSVNEPILRHAAQFNPLIHTVCRKILGYTGPIQLFYMTTIRANAAVCSVSKDDGKLYFNVLCFQQSQPLDPETGLVRHTSRLWTYWVQRAAIALSAGGSPEWAQRATGLYDPDIRTRFREHLNHLKL